MRDVSLGRALSKLGVCSRSEAAGIIAAGRVRVNGSVVWSVSRRVSMSSDKITVDEARVRKGAAVYILMHKPVGLVTTRSDERGRKTVYDLLGDVGQWVFPVGRLDKETSGLLLLTNDNRLGESLTNPLSKVPKTYHVTLDRAVREEDLQTLRSGMTIGDWKLRPAMAAQIGPSCVELTIVEGKNRQIRKMFESLGYLVTVLERTAIGLLSAGGLCAGQWRHLTEGEVALLSARSDHR